jgi:hypothetical protein
LTLTSNPTLSGGTANGVTYLNGSKVLTSGSALTFDGTALAVTGTLSATGTSTLAAINASGNITGTGTVGIANNSGYLMKDSAGNYRTMSILNSSNIMSFGDTDNFGASEVRLVAGTGNPLKLYGGNTLVATLTSSSLYTASGINVGIGLSNPTAKLSTLVANGVTPSISMANTASGLTYSWYASNTASNGFNGLGLFDGTDFRLVVNSSGNLGLGVTPSAWLSSTVAVQLGNYGSLFAFKNSGNVYLNNNSYTNSSGNEIYLNTAPAGRYRISDNAHYWYSAASGTAGDAISFTQALTLDADGRLLVGMTSNPIPGKTFSKDTQNPFVAWNPSTSGNSGFIDFGTEASFTERGYIYYNRAAGLVQLSATSDQRLKENIKDATSTLGVINQIKVRQFDWKETGNTNIGFIAQELYEIVPEAVCVGEDNEDGTVKRHWGVSKEYLVPYLVKAIQELKADFDAYKEAHP